MFNVLSTHVQLDIFCVPLIMPCLSWDALCTVDSAPPKLNHVQSEVGTKYNVV